MQFNKDEILMRLTKFADFALKEMDTLAKTGLELANDARDSVLEAISEFERTPQMVELESALRKHIEFWPLHSAWFVLLISLGCLMLPLMMIKMFKRSAVPVDEETIEIEELKEDELQAPHSVLSAPSPIKPRRSTRARKEVERFDPTHVKTPRKTRAVGA